MPCLSDDTARQAVTEPATQPNRAARTWPTAATTSGRQVAHLPVLHAGAPAGHKTRLMVG
jgi:hypothetical protein